MSENEKAPEQEEFDFKYEILPEDHTNFDLSFKLIVIGDAGVGKSCITTRAVKNIFEESYNATVGFEFFVFNVKINDKVIKLQIWDTCGQELYRSLITNFYRNSSLAIMVYAINSTESFENVEMWLRELRTHSNPDAKVFLIGNKIDLESERQVSKEMGEQFSKDNNFDLFMEASAKNGFNTQKVFIKAAKALLDDYAKYEKNVKKNAEKPPQNNDANGGEQNNLQEQNSETKKIEEEPKEKSSGCC